MKSGKQISPISIPEGLMDGLERDLLFTPYNDSIWGEDNWMKCYECPVDRRGNPVYHHKQAH